MVNSLVEKSKISIEPKFVLDEIDFADQEHITYIHKYFNCATYSVDGFKSDILYLPRLYHLFHWANFWRKSYRNKIDLKTWLNSQSNTAKLKQNPHSTIEDFVSDIYTTFNTKPQHLLRCESYMAQYIKYISGFLNHTIVREYCAYRENYYSQGHESSETKFGIKYTGRLLARVDLYFPHKEVIVELKREKSLVNQGGSRVQRCNYEGLFGKPCLLVFADDIHKFVELFLFRNLTVESLRNIF